MAEENQSSGDAEMGTNGNGTIIVRPADLPAPKNQGANWIVKSADRIARMLPSAVQARQFAANLVAAANSLEKDCDPKTVVMSAFNAAQIGLMVGGPLGHAYFVPFWNKNKGMHDCQLITGYQGFLELALSCGYLKTVYADVHLRGEEWDYFVDGTGPKLMHRPADDRNLQHWPDILHSYAIWQTRDGGFGMKIVSRKELEAVYDAKSKAWKNSPGPMCAKTSLIRASKWWQKTDRLARAVQLDEQHEMGVPQDCPIGIGNDLPEAESSASLSDYDVPDDGSMPDWEKEVISLNQAVESARQEDVERLRTQISGAKIPNDEKKRLIKELDAIEPVPY